MTDTPSDNTPPAAPPASSTKPKAGLFQRLFGTGPSETDLTIAVAPFADAAGQDHARAVAQAFQGLKHVRVRVLKDAPVLTPETADRSERLAEAAAQALGWLGREYADVVLWGDIPHPGTTLFIHFAAHPPVDVDPAGTISPFQALNLPVGFDAEVFGGLLRATALAAMNPNEDAKREARRQLVAEALESAAESMQSVPSDFTMREKATVYAAYGNALSTFAHLFPGTEAYQRAADAYAQALKGTLRGDSPTNWAYMQRNLGAVMQAMGERGDDVHMLEQAAEAYRAALEVFTRENTPFPWATTQNRLGEVLYRLDIKSGETAGLKQALTIYQDALKVLNRASTPMLWSETLNNLGQAAQVLGREINNPDVVERAVAACEQALKARDRTEHPTLWAATQNNMGSALFLLGRMTREDKHYQSALQAFMGAREIYESLGLARMVEVTDKNIQHAQSRLPEGGLSGADGGTMWWLEEDEPPKG